jgi:hypothetical protein
VSTLEGDNHLADIDYASPAHIGELSLTFATYCVLAQILIFVWLKETMAVSVVVTIAVLWGGIPILFERGWLFTS